MAETFGEANVILRVPLDELQRQLDESERMIIASNEKVMDAQVKAQREVVVARKESDISLLSLAALGLKVYGAWSLAALAVKAVGIAVMAIPVIAVSAVTGLVLLTGLLADGMLRVRAATAEAIDQFRKLDGSERAAQDFSETLRQIPLIGRLANQVWAMFGSTFGATAGQQQAAWTALVAKIEDGQVKVGLLGRAINGLVNLSTPGIIANLLGFDTDIVGRINQINQEIERQTLLIEQRNRTAAAGVMVRSADDQRLRAERDLELATLEGIERIKVENRHRHQDEMRMFDEKRVAVERVHAAEAARIRKEHGNDAGQVTRTGALLLEQSGQDAQRAVAAIEARRAITSQLLHDLARDRVALAEQEKAKQDELAAAEAKRQASALAANRENLMAGAAVARLQAAGEDFEAQRVDLANRRMQEIRAALDNGHNDQLGAIRAFYDARAALIDARERDQIERDKKLQEQRELVMGDANERLRSQILQARMKAAGMEMEAQQEAIMQRFQEQIDSMEREGNQVGAELARKLRDLELEAAGVQKQGRQAQSFRDVTKDRIAVGQGVDKGDRQRDLMIARLDRIATNTAVDSTEFA